MPCTREDKVLGPKTEGLVQKTSQVSHYTSQRESLLAIFRMPTPDENRLPEYDRMHVSHFYSIWHPSRWAPLLLPNRVRSHVSIRLYNPGLPPSITVYRFAILVLMSYLKHNRSSETFGYLAKYYQEAQKCIDASSISEVVFSSYLVAVYSLIRGESLQEALGDCDRFCRATVALKRTSTVKSNDIIWVETLWQDLLSSLYHIHCDNILFTDPGEVHKLARNFEQLRELLNKCTALVASAEDIMRLPLSMTTEIVCHKVRALSVFMQFHFQHFLYLMTNKRLSTAPSSLQNELCDVADRIIQLIGRLPNIPDYIHHAFTTTSELDGHSCDPKILFSEFLNVQPRGLISAKEGRPRDAALAILYTFARLIKPS